MTGIIIVNSVCTLLFIGMMTFISLLFLILMTVLLVTTPHPNIYVSTVFFQQSLVGLIGYYAILLHVIYQGAQVNDSYSGHRYVHGLLVCDGYMVFVVTC